MITVPEVVKQIIRSSSFLEEGLAQGLINHSALARKLQPKIRKKLLKDIELGAIIMALQRLEDQISSKRNKLGPILKSITDVTIRSNIVEYAYSNSTTLFEHQRQLLGLISGQNNLFLTITQGVFETSIFASQVLEEKIEQIFKDEQLRSKFEELSSITLVLPKEAVDVPGVYFTILKILAWEGINFVEVLSSYTELTIFLEKNNVDKAFSALKNL